MVEGYGEDRRAGKGKMEKLFGIWIGELGIRSKKRTQAERVGLQWRQLMRVCKSKYST